MDLKIYYQKIRQAEAGIEPPQVVIVSLETADGGRPGVMTEVTRCVAAKLVVDGRARLATEEEAAAFRSETSERRRAAEQAAAANRVQVTVISEADLRALRGSVRGK